MSYTGLLVIENINAILANIEEGTGFSSETVNQNFTIFIAKLENNKDFNGWCSILNAQYQECLSVMGENNSSFPHSTPSFLTSDSYFKKFSPLLDERNKITCNFPNCPIKFGTQRAYKSHMKLKHDGYPIVRTKDPVGTCRLISNVTGVECGTKLPVKGRLQRGNNGKKCKLSIFFLL